MFGLGKKRNKVEVAGYSKYRNSATSITCLIIASALISIFLFKTIDKSNSASPQFNEKRIQEYVELLKGQNNLVHSSLEIPAMASLASLSTVTTLNSKLGYPSPTIELFIQLESRNSQ